MGKITALGFFCFFLFFLFCFSVQERLISLENGGIEVIDVSW
jgi:hypothetical protein